MDSYWLITFPLEFTILLFQVKTPIQPPLKKPNHSEHEQLIEQIRITVASAILIWSSWYKLLQFPNSVYRMNRMSQ